VNADAPVCAAIDVGSNSVHLLVAAVGDDRLDVLADESVFLGLGALVDATGQIGTQACRRLAVAIHRYVVRATSFGAHFIVCAGTEPMRRASDGPAVAATIGRLMGLPLHVLEHEEEGYLTLLGVDPGSHRHRQVLVIDVGGGSTEFVVVGPGRSVRAVGVRVGGARLTSRHVAGDPPSMADVAALRHAAWDALQGAPDAQPDAAIVVGGTASNLVRVLPEAQLDRTLTAARLATAIELLVREPADATARRYGLNPIRARVLPAGATILEAILARYAIDRLETREASIREGAIRAVARRGEGWRAQLASLAAGWQP
jgi:exopolyphosphatase/pppGpp-phosphohydrolase